MGSGHVVLGCHFEVNTRAIVTGRAGDDTAGQVNAIMIADVAFEGNGTAIDIHGATSKALIQGIYILGEHTGIGGVSDQISSYGIRIRDNTLTDSTIIGVQANGDFSTAGISVGELTGMRIRAGNLIQGCNSNLNAGSTGVPWIFPTATAQAAAGYTFMGCNRHPAWTYSNLPTCETTFTATISNGSGGAGTILNVSAVGAGTLTVGQTVYGAGVKGNTVILNQTSGTTVASFTGSIAGLVLTVSSNTGIVAGQQVLGAGIPANTTIAGFISGLTWQLVTTGGTVGDEAMTTITPGGTGNYTVSVSQNIGSETMKSTVSIYEGDEYSITDSNTAASGNFAAAVTAGASTNHVKLRWNGDSAGWTICG